MEAAVPLIVCLGFIFTKVWKAITSVEDLPASAATRVKEDFAPSTFVKTEHEAQAVNRRLYDASVAGVKLPWVK